MGRRGRESALKRAKEKARQEKQEVKRARRAARSQGDDPETDVDQRALWEQYARLSEQHASKTISHDHYDKERERILTELGIEQPGQ